MQLGLALVAKPTVVHSVAYFTDIAVTLGLSLRHRLYCSSLCTNVFQHGCNRMVVVGQGVLMTTGSRSAQAHALLCLHGLLQAHDICASPPGLIPDGPRWTT